MSLRNIGFLSQIISEIAKHSRILKRISILIYFLVIATLLRSIFISGYNYRFDSDELFHLQTVFLLSKGLKPYVDFYSIYSPFLHWIILPVFILSGFSLKSIYFAKIVMIILYCLRLLVGFLLVNKIFNRRMAFIFLILILIEPFTNVTGMQIRPDNLALLFFLCSLWLLSHSVNNNRNRYIFLTGIIFALSFFASLKIAPALIAVALLYCIFTLINRQAFKFFIFVDGIVIGSIGLIAVFTLQGNLIQTIQQTLFDPWVFNNAITTPTNVYYYHVFESSLLYGALGRPVTYMIAIMLPLISAAGAYVIFKQTVIKKFKNPQTFIQLTIGASCFSLFLSLMFFKSVGMQYYPLVTFFYCILTAFIIDDIYVNPNIMKPMRNLFLLIVIIILLLAVKITYTGNILRSKTTDTPELVTAEAMWKVAPENTRTFTNVLFRLPAYPVIFGGTMSPYIVKRFGPVYQYIQKYNLSHLYLDEGYLNSTIDTESQAYIRNNFEKDDLNPLLWTRISQEKKY